MNKTIDQINGELELLYTELDGLDFGCCPADNTGIIPMSDAEKGIRKQIKSLTNDIVALENVYKELDSLMGEIDSVGQDLERAETFGVLTEASDYLNKNNAQFNRLLGGLSEEQRREYYARHYP